MNHYLKEVTRITNDCYANKAQLKVMIGVRHYINNNLDQELSLDLLANISLTSKFHLIRLFKKYYGQTPRQYIIDRRIEQSKVLLKKGMSVTDTCFEIGFDSPSSFSTLFKSRTGLTPRMFQKKAIFTKSA